MARKAVAASQQEQVLPRQRPLPVVGEGELLAGVALVPGSQHLVEDGERRVHQWNRVARRQDEPIHEGTPGPAQVPAHRAREQQGHEEVDLGPRSTGMPALPVVERQVDRFVDQLAQQLPVLEGPFGLLIEPVRGPGLNGRHRPRPMPPSRAGRSVRAWPGWPRCAPAPCGCWPASSRS